MSYFETENNSSKEAEQLTNTLWVEKYRPRTLDTYIGNEQLKKTFAAYIEKKDIPHILFEGPAGTGKSSASSILVKGIDAEALTINASDENGIDVIRNKIKNFATSSGFKDLRVIVLEEADGITPAGQGALRNVMEAYSMSVRFILSCNYVEKIIPAIISRCQVFKIRPLSERDVAIHLKHILDAENVQYTMEDFKYIVGTYHPDIRKIINFSQQSVIGGKLEITKSENVVDCGVKLIDSLKRLDKFNDIRQLVLNADIQTYDDYYGMLYEKVSEYAENKEAIIIALIADYMYQSSFVVHKEISFLACIGAILKELKKQ